ncbi:GLUG motif-containing protein, partial [Ammoniphilus sp. CFH 90114]|uniref:GLUG motif-containing protein n=1 Tax=Ammoniphilus sp. CFH 90114 TaxID=2493665 RepID=UPI00196A6055
MNYIRRLVVISILYALFVQFFPEATAVAAGSGTKDDPYIIHSVTDLKNIQPTGYYKLGADIDLSNETNWIPIGYYPGSDFQGVLDGAGHTIRNLTYITNDSSLYGGILGDIAPDGIVKNLNLENISITGSGQYYGALVGWNSGTIDRVNVKIKKVEANSNIGGLAGGNDGTITNSSVDPFDDTSYVKSTAAYNSIGEVGGLVGHNMGIIDHSMSAVSVTSTSQGAGGLVGRNENYSGGNSIIRYSFATGNVHGYNWVGGLIGIGGGVENSYATGNVSGTTSNRIDNAIGGLIGYYSGTTSKYLYSTGKVTGTSGATTGGFLGISNPGTGRTAYLSHSYWDIESSGTNRYGTNYSGTLSSTPIGKTTSKMMDPTTFAGWDTTIWDIQSGKYPTLKGFISAPVLSSNADLSNLTLNSGILSPSFTPDNVSYTVNVGNAVKDLDVTATVADANATIQIKETEATSGQATKVTLNVGVNIVTVQVTAQDGTKKT